MKISCFCGMVIGFILALLIGGGIYYYHYVKDHPGSGEESIDRVESEWNKVKVGGDAVIKKVRPVVKEMEKRYDEDSPIVRATGIDVKEK